MKAEILFNCDIGAYHANDYTSSSKLADLHPTPAHYHGLHIAKSIPRPTRKALDFGNAAHALILEGLPAYALRVAVHPETYEAPESKKADAPLIQKRWNWNANACSEWATQRAGRIILSPREHETALAMLDAVKGNPDARALLTAGRAEVTFRKHLGPFGVQCRADYWHQDGVTLPSLGRVEGPVIVDLKTCDTIERFEREYYDLRYFFRAEFYRLVVREVLAEIGAMEICEVEPPAFYFVAVEKHAPYRCEVFEPDEDSLEVGRKEVHAAMKTLRECYQTGEWPGARAGVQKIGLKTWQRQQAEAKAEAAIEREAA